jgi:hypothetical protein
MGVLDELTKRGAKVRRVTVLALGSMTGEGGRRSRAQMAAAEGVRKCVASSVDAKATEKEGGGILEDDGEATVETVAQDPVFNALDEEVLHVRGMRVVQEPGAWQLIDPSTLVWAVHSSRPVLAMSVAAGGGAGMIVGNVVEPGMESG